MKILLVIAFLCLHINGQEEPNRGPDDGLMFDDWGDDWVDVTDDDFDIEKKNGQEEPNRGPDEAESCDNSPAFYACQKDVTKLCNSAKCKKRCIFENVKNFNQECEEAINDEWNRLKMENDYRSFSEPMASDLVKMLVPCDMIERYNGHHGNNNHHSRHHGRHHSEGKQEYKHRGWHGHDDDDDDVEYRHHKYAKIHRMVPVFLLTVLCCCIGCCIAKKMKKRNRARLNNPVNMNNPAGQV